MEMKLENVKKACRSIGGIKSILFFWDNGYMTMPDQKGAFISDPLIFTQGMPIFSIFFRRQSVKLQEKKITSGRAGDYFQSFFTFFVPKNRLAVKTFINRTRNRSVHAIVTDHNGFRTMLLNLRNDYEFDSGDRIQSKNGYSFRFYTNSEYVSPAYLPETVDVPDECEGGLIQLDGAQLVSLDGDCLIQLD